MKKIGKIVGNVLVTVILVFSILMTVMVLSSTKHDSGLPNLFGKAVFNVLTDSMMSEEGFPEGSLIIVELTDPEQDEPYKVGDVVTFWRYYEDQPYLETHRIVADTYTQNQNEVVDGVWIHGGEAYYVTRGDNTPDIDMNQDLSIDYLSNQRIVAKWTGTAIPHLGSILSFLQSQLGFMLCVVIPTAIFFFFELFKFISALMDAKKEKAVAAVKDAEEEIKQRVMAEMLAAQAAANPAPAEAVKAAEEKPKPVEETKKSEESEEDIKKKAVEEYIAKQEAEKAAAAKAAEEEEIKRKAVEEYIKQQEAEKAAAEQAAKEEELKKQAIAEYLAQQEAEKNAEETTEE
ncbi:MAG: signal peptidase I [Clostridia bacterium]|nr:signal peptidase I [Clostridia bacterium]